jgi:cardiolipin synthase
MSRAHDDARFADEGGVRATDDMAEPSDPRLDRVLTIPNLLSVGRLALFGWFLQSLFGTDARLAAAIALSIAGVTDFLDGYIARHFHQVSNLGKILDPTVDRMMTTGTIISLMVYGALPIWLGAIVLFREVGISLAAIAMAARGVRTVEVLFIGKLGTFGFMVAMPILLYSHARGVLEHDLNVLAWVILVPSVVCAFVAAAAYIPRARGALDGGR